MIRVQSITLLEVYVALVATYFGSCNDVPDLPTFEQLVENDRVPLSIGHERQW